MTKFKPSILQQAFFDWVTTGEGSCVLEAVAGSGKTTTLLQALKLMKGTIYFGAFNKKIADEIQAKAGNKMNLTVSTLHAAGFRAWRKAAPKVKVDSDKMKNIFKEVTFRSMSDGAFQGPVLQLVSYAKQSGVGIAQNPNDVYVWQSLIDHFNVETFDERSETDNTQTIISLARACLKKSTELNVTQIDFDDMIFAPLFHNVKIDKYDWVLIDEAQDTNYCRRLLCLRMMTKNTRLVAVGDRNQAIYGFTGADDTALDLIQQETNAIALPLTVSYRCPKSVVQYARQWVNHIQAHENASEGIVREAPEDTLQDEVKVGDAILCRFNAPLIKYVYKLIAAGIPAKVEGREIGNSLLKLANRWKVKTLDQLLNKLEKYEEREVAKYELKEQMKKAGDVKDQVACLRIIIDRVILKKNNTNPPQLAISQEIQEIFGAEEEMKPVVTLSSIHKSKGREFTKVIWLRTGANSFARKDWELQQETNLKYVAVTRAINELVVMDVAK